MNSNTKTSDARQSFVNGFIFLLAELFCLLGPTVGTKVISKLLGRPGPQLTLALDDLDLFWSKGQLLRVYLEEEMYFVVGPNVSLATRGVIAVQALDFYWVPSSA